MFAEASGDGGVAAAGAGQHDGGPAGVRDAELAEPQRGPAAVAVPRHRLQQHGLHRLLGVPSGVSGAEGGAEAGVRGANLRAVGKRAE